MRTLKVYVCCGRVTIRPGFPGHVLFSGPRPGVRMVSQECGFCPGFTKCNHQFKKDHFTCQIHQNILIFNNYPDRVRELLCTDCTVSDISLRFSHKTLIIIFTKNASSSVFGRGPRTPLGELTTLPNRKARGLRPLVPRRLGRPPFKRPLFPLNNMVTLYSFIHSSTLIVPDQGRNYDEWSN
jgi:hypothetical protein